ncbi:MAG: biotin--[acetyl-CoA-carboxylase] ligase, partial [Xanthomonadales bacterium]|nr:biotin--[acetyl-CoA-carboxylase] ligase [Xanthomonadales bacterium]
VTDLAELQHGTPPPRNQLAATLITHLLQGLSQFEREGFAPFAEDYARYDLLHKQQVRVIMPQYEFTGECVGVDARGALCVRSGGELKRVDSAEVSVRKT